MSATKPKRNLATFDLSKPAKAALARIKKNHGITKVAAVERGIWLLENSLTDAQAAPSAQRN